MASNGSCFMAIWVVFKNPPFGGRPNRKPRDHGTLESQNRWFYYILSSVRTMCEHNFDEIAIG